MKKLLRLFVTVAATACILFILHSGSRSSHAMLSQTSAELADIEMQEELEKQVEGSNSWSPVKVRQMVVRLFQAVAAMDMRVTRKYDDVGSKLSALQSHDSAAYRSLSQQIDSLGVRIGTVNASQSLSSSLLQHEVSNVQGRPAVSANVSTLIAQTAALGKRLAAAERGLESSAKQTQRLASGLATQMARLRLDEKAARVREAGAKMEAQLGRVEQVRAQNTHMSTYACISIDTQRHTRAKAHTRPQKA